MSTTATESGELPGWVATQFGVTMTGDGSPDDRLAELVILGLRRNRRRAHLLVSTVLGKHIPTPPAVVRAAADDLGDAVIQAIGATAASDSVVLGFAETATGLGHCVADRLGAAVYLHSTRRLPAETTVWGTFEEGHSHATTHLLQPSDPALLQANPDAPLVLVDDEISTGSTALRAISQLHQIFPRTHYVIASLVDMRSAAHRADTDRVAAELDVRIDHIALAHGSIELPAGLVDSVWELTPDALNPRVPDADRGQLREIAVVWPAGLPDGGRHGILRTESVAFAAAAAELAQQARALLDPARPVIVVGHEELMYLPLIVAERLADAGLDTRYQTTTRSPAHVRDTEGYPLRRGFTFTAPEPDPAAPRFVYNLMTPAQAADATLPQILLIVDSPADTPELRAGGGVLDVLSAAGHDVVLMIVPATAQLALTDRRLR